MPHRECLNLFFQLFIGSVNVRIILKEIFFAMQTQMKHTQRSWRNCWSNHLFSNKKHQTVYHQSRFAFTKSTSVTFSLYHAHVIQSLYVRETSGELYFFCYLIDFFKFVFLVCIICCAFAYAVKYAYTCANECLSVCLCVCINIYVCTCLCMVVCACICVCVCISVCV